MASGASTNAFISEYPTKPSLHRLTHQFGPSPPKQFPSLAHLGKCHVESFNFMLTDGLKLAIQSLDPVEFLIPENGSRISLWISDVNINRPGVVPGAVGTANKDVYPSEARQRGGSYKGRITVRAGYSINRITQPMLEKVLGNIPIMLRSLACHLHNLTPAQLVQKGEHEQEWGGYFVVGGHERILRMLQTTRRNYPVAMKRGSWKNRGKNFSDMGVLLECGKKDLTTTKNVLHFVTTGNAKYMFALNKELFFVPVILILKCLKDVPDSYIYRRLMVGVGDDPYYKGNIVNMLRELLDEGVYNQEQAQEYIGRSFRPKVQLLVPAWYTDREACAWLIKNSVAIHLDNDNDKFDIICVMIKKLFALVQDKCVVEGVDSLMMHEIVLGGHLYLQLLKEKLDDFCTILKSVILKKAKTVGPGFDLTPTVMNNCATKTGNLEKPFENFLGTGNLPSRTGLGLMQDKGLTIMAENINRMRYMSHFRAIHRGAFFTEMRTTEVRALLPDAWGFVCPVHTPDGSPCGLLNHLATPVEIVTHVSDVSKIPGVLHQLGMVPVESMEIAGDLTETYDVILDGRLMGWIEKNLVRDMSERLRMLKITPTDTRVPEMTEIVLVPERDIPGQYPGLFIFTGAARLMRPVYNLAHNCMEYLGTFESVYMDICIREKEAYPGLTTHMEIRPTSFLSNLACTIPLPDFNQSPRNMYQCQMGKQTMASPIHTWHLNSETKIYRLQTPASPFFRPAHYDYIGLDDYPMGTNAIVAVISYSGYDMEDAMIMNRMSLQRGFCSGMIYKAEFVDLREKAGKRKGDKCDDCGLVFCRDPSKPELAKFLDTDGLPFPGMKLEEGDPMYCYFSREESKFVTAKYKYKEAVFVDSIKLCSNDTGTSGKNRAVISFRIPRNPSVGDKFASRAGQKGICSVKWPCEDLPWTSNGLFPDIVFNPHGFPSRMTIAMMIESMAGKGGAIHGSVHDATPFTFSEDPDNDAIDYFAKQLEHAGYNYYGTETLYSGVSGVEMKAEIFFGIIHYQRLRHMVSDKFQVRSTGPIDCVTRQPVKGRKKGGGVRFGEMERDSLLSHGATFLLQDRLFHGSDKSKCSICKDCGSFLSPRIQAGGSFSERDSARPVCVLCKSGDSVQDFEVPFIFLHLVKELLSINIKVKLGNSNR
eukprot:GFUD01026209.1.p1 GENE.GFUD01026209.1~~GFUD01026209.1.p1  ORF type:complete len:1157 (+),score=299.03 GFUD01026209.1:56-3526(+)